MSKVKVGDKFIIEIGSVYDGPGTGSPQYIIKGFDKLILDDKGLKMLEKYEPDEIFDMAAFGAEKAWELGHDIMRMPIHERAETFKVSHNATCFADISEKYTVFEASGLYEAHLQKHNNLERKQEIQDKLAEFIKENGYTLVEIKGASKALIKHGVQGK